MHSLSELGHFQPSMATTGNPQKNWSIQSIYQGAWLKRFPCYELFMFFQMTEFKFRHFFFELTHVLFNSVLFPQQDLSSWLKLESLEVSKTKTIGFVFPGWVILILDILIDQWVLALEVKGNLFLAIFERLARLKRLIICFNLSKGVAEIGEVFFPWFFWWSVQHSWLEVILYSKQLPYVKAPVEQL